MTMVRFVPCALALLMLGCGGARIAGEKADLPLGRFQWPLEGKVSSGFGGRGGRQHNGVDILAPEGTPVRAASSGLVLYADDGWKGYGNAVLMEHGSGVTTLYGHLREIHVKSGDAVEAGSVIGTVGRTGNATAYHLHFELVFEGRPVDPAEYLRTADERR